MIYQRRMVTKLEYYKKNWKLMVHLMFRTYKFGVNNDWWFTGGSSMFGYPWYKKIWMIVRIRPFIYNLKCIYFRAVACHFIDDDSKKIIGWYNHQPWWYKFHWWYYKPKGEKDD